MSGPSSHAFDGAAGVFSVGGRHLRLAWHDLEGCDIDLSHLDGVLSGLLAGAGFRRGAVLTAVDASGRVVGAGALEFTQSDGAHGAVAVAVGWRHQGLGAELAHRVTAAAREGGCRYLTCRCSRGLEDAERTAALFDEVCVSRVRVAFQQLLVLRLPA